MCWAFLFVPRSIRYFYRCNINVDECVRSSLSAKLYPHHFYLAECQQNNRKNSEKIAYVIMCMDGVIESSAHAHTLTCYFEFIVRLFFHQVVQDQDNLCEYCLNCMLCDLPCWELINHAYDFYPFWKLIVCSYAFDFSFLSIFCYFLLPFRCLHAMRARTHTSTTKRFSLLLLLFCIRKWKIKTL